MIILSGGCLLCCGNLLRSHVRRNYRLNMRHRHMNCKWQDIAFGIPRKSDPNLAEEPWLDFSSGYVQRALDQLPRQGTKRPWKLYQNYALDLMTLRFGAVDDGSMEFHRKSAGAKAA